VIDFLRAERLAVPAHAALGVGHLERHMSESEARST
jgi:hypothetical protein